MGESYPLLIYTYSYNFIIAYICTFLLIYHIKMSDQDLISLVRKRGSVKARITNFKTVLEGLVKLELLSDIQILDLQQKVKRIKSLNNEFEGIQCQIECIAENVEQQYEERLNIENNLDLHLATAKSILSKYTNENDNESVRSSVKSLNNSIKSVSNAPVNSAGSNITSENNVEQAPLKNSIKLPVIELPKFDGKYEAWLEFRDTFESLINKNVNISDIQKFHYLRAALHGDAAQVISSIEFSAPNYKVAYEALLDRYNNTRLLVHNHIKAIFCLDTITKESATQIRNLTDKLFKHLRLLSQLDELTKNWDTLLIYIVTTKLDKKTYCEWEKHVNNLHTKATISDMKEFLTNRANLLETLGSKINDNSNEKRYNSSYGDYSKTRRDTRALFSANSKCVLCNKEHTLQTCSEFHKLNTKNRMEHVRKFRLCTNCLKGGHFSKQCRSSVCKKCGLKHNTLLHFDNIIDKQSQSDSNNTIENSENAAACLTSYNSVKHVLLSTAYIQVMDQKHNSHTVRAILDSGSQSSYITADLCDRLNLNKESIDLAIVGINNALSKIKYKCNLQMKSQYSSYRKNIECLVVPEITGNIPNIKINVEHLNIPNDIVLADVNFYEPAKIDVLIGADIFYELLCIGQIKLGVGKPIIQNTRLGWIISGPLPICELDYSYCNFTKNIDIQDQLTKFWEIEEIEQPKLLSDEEQYCEEFFKLTTTRNDEGRFVVSIPLKESVEKLGESKSQAERRFYSLENKLKANPELKEMYTSFMREYELLGHMTQISNVKDKLISYYMPHHGVLKEQSITSKLRVVYDASTPTSTGFSLNNIQCVGPTIQDDLMSIILRFRMHRFVISADVTKMYRQILIAEDQRNLQRILWRSDPAEKIMTFELNTVTYGTASASYLATRCIKQLALECKDKLPMVSEVIEHDFYVDDLLTGSSNVDQAIHIAKQVTSILHSAGFELRKWLSNEPRIIKGLNITSSATEVNTIQIGSGEKCKTLGLAWSVQHDALTYNIQNNCRQDTPITKRTILSHVSQIFDPLGLVTPCTVIAKIILQKLWMERVAWDEVVPKNIAHTWLKLREELLNLNSINIARRVTCDNYTRIELHGFSDASESAYGACIYIRSINCEGNISLNLLCAKSKVAPIKSQTIPRLELCGALTLSRLLGKVLQSINVQVDHCYCWTDSTIVLGWLKSLPNQLKIFIGNRVSEIQNNTSMCEWRHVPSKDNTADILSRGMYPNELRECHMWWQGPSFLHTPPSQWPNTRFDIQHLPEMKEQTQSLLSFEKSENFPFNRFSSLQKLRRTVAYLLRFKNNCLNRKLERNFAALSVDEINKAYLRLIKLSQRETFSNEYSALGRGECVASGRLITLSPFLDDDNIIRVGGRLANADFEYDKKYPILLSSKHHLTKLIFEREHLRLYHAGPQSLLASVREKFWPLAGRNLAKYIVRKCVTCFRNSPKFINPIMGNLPKTRVAQNFPFFTTGVDYAGPFYMKNHKGRGAKLSKCYVSVFICFSTKALHLELVTDLTTETFILALRRFASRRGKPNDIYSDNGRNFLGARSELKDLGKYLLSNKQHLINAYEQENIRWHFIPANSPHFGGLWEAGVKSFKYHLKRTVGNANLTFEELYSVIVQIEAILNSRPLCPLSTDPCDLVPLTPAHFLIGKTLTEIPDPDVIQLKQTTLSQFQRIQSIKQHFWKRWNKEYISELQQRKRWNKSAGSSLEEGQMVLVKDDNLPPMKWKLGRVVKLHFGSDNVARVAAIKTNSGEIKRALVKLCPLPINYELNGV